LPSAPLTWTEVKEPLATTTVTGLWYETLAAELSTDTAGVFFFGVAETAAEGATPEDDKAAEVHPVASSRIAAHPDTATAPARHLRRPGICTTAMRDTMPHPPGSLRPAHGQPGNALTSASLPGRRPVTNR
jgi:hypothetical protein